MRRGKERWTSEQHARVAAFRHSQWSGKNEESPSNTSFPLDVTNIILTRPTVSVRQLTRFVHASPADFLIFLLTSG